MGTIFANAAGVYVWLGEQGRAAEITYDISRDFVPAYTSARSKGQIQTGLVRYGDEGFWKRLGLVPWTNEQAIQ